MSNDKFYCITLSKAAPKDLKPISYIGQYYLCEKKLNTISPSNRIYYHILPL